MRGPTVHRRSRTPSRTTMTYSKRVWSAAPLPKGYPLPVGPYTPAVHAGSFVFVSGQTPRDPVTGETGKEDIQVQSRRTLFNLKAVLGAAGATLDDVVSVTVYLANEEDWGAFNEVYKEFFKEPYPTRTAIGCSLRGILVEVSAIAMVVPSTGSPTPSKGFRSDMTLY